MTTLKLKSGSPEVSSPARTGSLVIDGLTHRYGSSPFALQDINLEIEPGEFVTLLGPSGCGKTTLLRIIAGLIRPTEGRVFVSGDDVTAVSPHRRPVNMVFQRPMLFPHLDVMGNVAFGLRVAKTPKKETEERVKEALRVVRLERYGSRRVNEMSGGQMQRVALARALVNRPQVVLLDEPLSALDLRIRVEMEAELRRMHREMGATFVYVTHDQREALALSDRIAVFDHGRLDQLGPPRSIYRAPSSPFTAGFVGDANVIQAEIIGGVDGPALSVGSTRLSLADETRGKHASGPVWLIVRPEVVSVRALTPETRSGAITGVILDVAYRGTGYSYRVRVDGMGQELKAEVPDVAGAEPLDVGEHVVVAWDSARAQILERGELP